MAAFRPRGRHGETLSRRALAVEAPSVGAQNRRSDMSERCHPGESRQNQAFVKSLTKFSQQLFKTPPPKKTPPSVVRADPEHSRHRRLSKF